MPLLSGGVAFDVSKLGRKIVFCLDSSHYNPFEVGTDVYIYICTVVTFTFSSDEAVAFARAARGEQ